MHSVQREQQNDEENKISHNPKSHCCPLYTTGNCQGFSMMGALQFSTIRVTAMLRPSTVHIPAMLAVLCAVPQIKLLLATSKKRILSVTCPNPHKTLVCVFVCLFKFL